MLASLAFAKAPRVKLPSSHGLERLNQEVKRRAKVVARFPKAARLRRRLGAILAEQNDQGR